MHESDGESSNQSSHKSYKKVKKGVIQSISKQLSRISDMDENESKSPQPLPKTPILTLSLDTNQEFNIKDKVIVVPEEQTVYKPALKNLTKITSPIGEYIHQSYTPTPGKARSSKFTSPVDGKPNSRFTSPIPPFVDSHLHVQPAKTQSVYSDDFE